MLIKDILTEKYIHNVDFDMNIFARNMAALRASKSMPDNYPDAIVFLGFIGDPATNYHILSKPARIANYDRRGEIAANLPPGKQGPWRHEYPEPSPVTGKPYLAIQGSGSYHKIDPEIAANPNEIEFDIFVSGEVGDLRNPRTLHINQSRVIAHELRHRGFQIIDEMPSLKSKMPEIYQTVGSWGYALDPKYQPYITTKVNSQSMTPSGKFRHDFYLSHAMIYALEHPAVKGHYDDEKQRLAYKDLYWQCERVVRQYLDGKSVPPQGWALLRNQIDKATPDNIEISIKPGPDHAVVVGRKKPEVTTSQQPQQANPATNSRQTVPQSPANIPTTGIPGIYKIKPGDTITKIARQYSTTIDNLMKLNPQITNPNLIYAGRTINVP